MTQPKFEQFMSILNMLPTVQDVVFRGHPAVTGEVPGVVTNGVVSTSRNPRMASDNFTTLLLLCIVSATGRVNSLSGLARPTRPPHAASREGRAVPSSKEIP